MADFLDAQRRTEEATAASQAVTDIPIAPAEAPAATSLPAVPIPYEASSGSPDLVDAERADLAACEAAIDTLRVAFWAAGKALQVIRDARLYRGTNATFEEYVEDRWQMSRPQAYRLIQAWPLAEALSPIGDKTLNEGQIRELIPVANRYGQDAAVTVYRTIAETGGVRVTAGLIKGAVAVLPDDRFDKDEAVEQIRAYLAGEAIEPAAPDATPAEVFAAEAKRVRTALRRIRNDTIRTAGADNPEEVRQLAAELRELADEMEKDAQ
jgi:uncharacterized protein (DUF2252 family)